MTDFDLLSGYASSGDGADFAALVDRYASLVYSAALRQTQHPHDAEEISQMVFMILARKAGNISEGTVISGWLLRTTRFVSQNLRRKESHRRRAEREVAGDYLTETDLAWKQIAPLLDEALGSLSEKDRDAVVLRFFDQKSFREIGQILRTSEDNAQKRVSRALVKLRGICLKRGVVVPTTIFTAVVAANSVQAAPGYLATSAMNAVTASTAASGSTEVKAMLSALERDQLKKLRVRVGKAVLLVMLALLSTYLFWPSTVSRSSGGLGDASTRPIPPQNAPALASGPTGFPQDSVGQLRLRVIDSQTAAPLSKARVTAKWGIMPYPQTNEMLTDIQGECVASFNLQSRPYWALLIQIIQDGYVPTFLNWSEPRGDLVEDIPKEYTARLTRGQVVGGVVLSDNGEPVSDARVIVEGPVPTFDGDGSADRDGLAITHDEITDAQGRWLCNHVPPELGKIYFKVFHPDFVAARFDIASSQDPTNSGMNRLSQPDLRSQIAIMTLKHGLVVSGVVVDEAGKPVVEARVTRDRAWREPSANETTGANGGFRFGNAPKPELILTVQADGFVAQDMPANLTANTNALRFELSRASVLRGMVVDESGKPIPKATVVADGGDFSNDRFEWGTLTDEQGRFAWLSVPPAYERYDVYADGFTSAKLELVADGEEKRITLSKNTGVPRRRISGLVTDADSRHTVTNFEVWVAPTVRIDHQLAFRTFVPELRTTGTDGRYAFMVPFKYVGAAERYEVEIRAHGYSAAKLITPGQPTNGYQANFELRAAAILTATVLSPDGEPVVEAIILICAKPEDGAYMRIPGQLDLTLSRGTRTKTDTNGRFAIPAATGTEPVFIFHKLGYVEMPAAELLRAEPQRLQSWGQVTGILMIGSQTATNQTVLLGNAIWRDHTLPQVFLTTTTDVDGRFSLDGVPPGTWGISHELRRRGSQAGPIPLTQTLTIQVRPGQVTQVKLGGKGRMVRGRLRTSAAGKNTDFEGYLVGLTPNLPSLPTPSREQFASEAEFVTAMESWRARRLEFRNTAAGPEALSHPSGYGALVDANGSFEINDVLPGNYVMGVQAASDVPGSPASLQFDPVVMVNTTRWLDSFRREVIVPEAGDGDATPFELGVCQATLEKP